MRAVIRAVALGLCLLLTVSAGEAQQPKKAATPRTVSGVEAIRLLQSQGKSQEAIDYAYRQLFSDVRQPEALYLLAGLLESRKKGEEAAVYYTWLLRVLEQATPDEVKKFAPLPAQKRLALLNKDYEQQKAKYVAGRKFEAPDKVDDLWMTQVTADLCNPHGLYAYDLVGGRKYKDPEHIAIAGTGVMHRNGWRTVEEIAGRKGVLYGPTGKPGDKGFDKTKHAPQIKLTNTGKCKLLRMGVKGFGFPFQVKVQVDGKEALSQKIGEKEWTDLRIDLGDAAGKAVEVVVELTVPEGQKWHEGAWIDYLDFFND